MTFLIWRTCQEFGQESFYWISEIVMEAFRSKCNRCTERQKEIMNLIKDWYTKNRPEQWEAFVAKYQQTER